MKGSPVFPQCGFSAAVVQILGHLGVKFKGVDVLADPQIRQGIKRVFELADGPAALREGRVRRRLRHHPRDVRDRRTAARFSNRTASRSAPEAGRRLIPAGSAADLSRAGSRRKSTGKNGVAPRQMACPGLGDAPQPPAPLECDALGAACNGAWRRSTRLVSAIKLVKKTPAEIAARDPQLARARGTPLRIALNFPPGHGHCFGHGRTVWRRDSSAATGYFKDLGRSVLFLESPIQISPCPEAANAPL